MIHSHQLQKVFTTIQVRMLKEIRLFNGDDRMKFTVMVDRFLHGPFFERHCQVTFAKVCWEIVGYYPL